MELTRIRLNGKFTLIEPLDSIGSSESFLFTALTNTTPPRRVLLKLYTLDDYNMIFEEKLYEYLSTLDEKYKKYFITYLGNFTINYKEVKDLIPNIKPKNNKMFGIVLDYILGYTTLHSYLTLYKLSEQSILNIIFQILYSIYILNHKLGIIHNDFHFDNIFIKKLKNPIKEIIEFEGKTYEYNKHYDLIIYDFDCSTKLSYPKNTPVIINGYLDSEYIKDYGSYNRYSQKDTFIFLAQLVKYRKVDKVYDKLFDILTENKYNLKTAFLDNFKNNTIFWSAYAPIKGNKFLKDCSNTKYPDLDIKYLFQRFLKLCKYHD